MNVKEAKARFGEKLAAIEDLKENAFSHYLRVEEAVSKASLIEVQEYYARVHGMLPEDAVTDPRFPWHLQYKYGDGKRCCENCQELEMALSVTVLGSDLDHPLRKALPEFDMLAVEFAAEA